MKTVSKTTSTNPNLSLDEHWQNSQEVWANTMPLPLSFWDLNLILCSGNLKILKWVLIDQKEGMQYFLLSSRYPWVWSKPQPSATHLPFFISTHNSKHKGMNPIRTPCSVHRPGLQNSYRRLHFQIQIAGYNAAKALRNSIEMAIIILIHIPTNEMHKKIYQIAQRDSGWGIDGSVQTRNPSAAPALHSCNRALINPHHMGYATSRKHKIWCIWEIYYHQCAEHSQQTSKGVKNNSPWERAWQVNPSTVLLREPGGQKKGD